MVYHKEAAATAVATAMATAVATAAATVLDLPDTRTPPYSTTGMSPGDDDDYVDDFETPAAAVIPDSYTTTASIPVLTKSDLIKVPCPVPSIIVASLAVAVSNVPSIELDIDFDNDMMPPYPPVHNTTTKNNKVTTIIVLLDITIMIEHNQ